MSLIEKQKKLYKFFHQSSQSEHTESQKVTIKTELEETGDETAEDVFIDCSTFISNSDLKLEETELPVRSRKASKRQKELEVNNEEHQKLLDEFRVVLKKRKDKK